MARAIECFDLCKSFQSGNSTLHILKKVNLHIEQGEFIVLMGPSGCGKTTLLSIIAGILTSDSGTCHVLGTSYQTHPQEKLSHFRSRNIGFIFQSFRLISTLSVVENVAIPLKIQNTDSQEALSKAHIMLEQLGLKEYAWSRPTVLSGGQQQRVAIARALVHRPRIILCDEPTSALDQQTGTEIMDIMKSMNQAWGTTFLVITHDERIAHYAHRIVHMNDGIVYQEGV